MAALETVGQYLTECRVLLQDQHEPYRYADAELVEALNIALTEARRLRADLFLPLFDVPFITSSGSVDTAAKVTFDPMYRSALVYYIVGRAQLRDDEPTVDTRASAMLTKFTQQLLVIAS